MEREYDLFEQFPNGDVLWRMTVIGHENAIQQLRELAATTYNEVRAVHLPTQAVVAVMNRPNKESPSPSRPIRLLFENPVETCQLRLMTIVPPTELRPENRRRSKRVKARVPVVVRFQTADKHSISEKTHTMIVNDNGALILLAAAVEVQQIIRLENVASGEELLCRVTSLGPSFMGKKQVAVEFVIPTPGFWDNRL